MCRGIELLVENTSDFGVTDKVNFSFLKDRMEFLCHVFESGCSDISGFILENHIEDFALPTAVLDVFQVAFLTHSGPERQL